MLLILLCLVLIVCALKRHNPNAKRVVVQLASGISAADADQAAAEHGYVNLGELDSLAGYHVFEEIENRKRQVKREDRFVCICAKNMLIEFRVCCLLFATNGSFSCNVSRILNTFRHIRT